MTDSKRKPFRIWITDEERQYLEAEAAKHGVTRGEIMRKRCLAGGTGTDPALYSKCVEEAARLLPGSNRIHVEHAVSKVIVALNKH